MSESDDILGEQLHRVLGDQARAMEPADQLDDGLARIRGRIDSEQSLTRRWAVPVAAAAAAVLVLVGGLVAWPRGDGTPVGAGTQGPTSGAPSATLTTDGPSSTPSPTPSGTASTTTGPAITVPVYYGDTFSGKTLLYREFRHVSSGSDPVATALVTMLLLPPLDPDYRTLWPSGTVASWSRSGDTAIVTLSSAPTKTTPADLPLQQVVYTVTATDTSIHRVTVIYHGGQATALTRAVSYLALAPVWLSAPLEGATVSSPVAFGGIAEVFEAHVNWEVDAAGGAMVAQGFAMASQAAPGRFPWSATVSLPPGTYLLKAFAISPKDGSVTWPDTKRITVH